MDLHWLKVLFSDKSKLWMFGNDGTKYVKLPKREGFAPKYQTPTVKNNGGNVMVWGAFSRDSIDPHHRIEGIMHQMYS